MRYGVIKIVYGIVLIYLLHFLGYLLILLYIRKTLHGVYREEKLVSMHLYNVAKLLFLTVAMRTQQKMVLLMNGKCSSWAWTPVQVIWVCFYPRVMSCMAHLIVVLVNYNRLCTIIASGNWRRSISISLTVVRVVEDYCVAIMITPIKCMC